MISTSAEINCITTNEHEYPVFIIMDKPEVYNKDVHNDAGIYFIQSKNYFPLRNKVKTIFLYKTMDGITGQWLIIVLKTIL